MTYPVTGFNTLSADKWIPELYAQAVLKLFYPRTILNYICNTDYEGMIKQKGDTVNVPTLGNIIVRDHVDGQNLDYQFLQPGYVQLVIDKGLYWAIAIPKVSAHQAYLDLFGTHNQHAATTLKLEVQTRLFSTIFTYADAANKGNAAGAVHGGYGLGQTGAPVECGPDEILELILDAAAVLDEQNRPEEGRYFVLPPWAARQLKSSDVRPVYVTGDQKSAIRTGNLGMIDRFNLFSTTTINSVTDTAKHCYNCFFGDKYATSFAAQIDTAEQVQFSHMFGNGHRALFVYGWKVLDPLGLGHAYITPKTGD